jgi:hypothetical protein
MKMKKMLVLAVLGFSMNVFAQGNKTLVYCDYNATPQEDSVYMDLYFDYDATANTYQNLEVGFLNPENTGYPDYLYTVTSVMDVNGTQADVVASKDANSVMFNLPAASVEVNGSMVPNYQVVVVDGKVNGFEVVANGTFGGKALTDVTFTCYDPSALNQVPAQQQQR